MKIDKKLIKELVDNLDEFNLTELESPEGDKKIKVSKGGNITTTVSKGSNIISNNKTVLNNDDNGIRIKSPIIGLSLIHISEPTRPY